MQYKALALGLTALSILSINAYAAPRFDPANEPQVWLAPIALSNTDLRPVPDLRPDGGAQGFRPWFENGAWQGDLIELDISATGTVSSTIDLTTTPPTQTAAADDEANWSARIRFNAAAAAANNHANTRNIIIGNAANNGIRATPFRIGSPGLSVDQQSAILSNAQTTNGNPPPIGQIVNFLRGDRSNETPNGPLRGRLNVLGDIIHSPPQYVAAPGESFNFANYAVFANENRNRAPRVYVGANDGMLHAFDAATGDEVFAYIPSMVTANLGALTLRDYNHTYFVDGQLATADVLFDDNTWHTVLVGGLGAGGKGFFALDITDAEVSTEDALSRRLLWEVDASDPDIGFSYSRPTIARLNNGRWYAIVGNGYNSVRGKAELLVIDIENGNVREIETNNSGNNTNPNGLSSPSLIDTDGNNTADIAYAGDINGNLWKFDLSAANPNEWHVAFGGQPLLALGPNHPIIVPPDVVPNPAINNSHFVYVGTGRAFTDTDLANSDTQSLYGVIDNGQPGVIDNGPAPGNTQVVDQTLTPNRFDVPDVSPQFVRTTTTNSVNPFGDAFDSNPENRPNRAWRVNYPPGERFLTEIQTRASRVQGLTYNPTTNPPENWLTQPAFNTGGAPSTTILDLNGDGSLDSNDHVDGDGDGDVTAAQEDIPMALLLGQGIRSRPTIAVINSEVDTALINGLFVSTIQCPQRFQDICLGRLTDPDNAQAGIDQLQDRIDAILNPLGEELGQLDPDSITAQEELLLQRIRDKADISDIISALRDVTETAQTKQTLDELEALRAQQQNAIDFRTALAEDAGLRETGGIGDINGVVAVTGIRSLGPNFALGRHSWVELDQ